jgi:hypothetical protein
MKTQIRNFLVTDVGSECEQNVNCDERNAVVGLLNFLAYRFETNL